MPVLLQWHVKDPGHSAKSADGRLHLNTHTSLTQRSRSGLLCRCPGMEFEPIRNELTRNFSGNIRPQSSQLAEPLWTDPGIKNGISVRELIFFFKKEKAQAGNEWSNILPKSPKARKKPPPHSLCFRPRRSVSSPVLRWSTAGAKVQVPIC